MAQEPGLDPADTSGTVPGDEPVADEAAAAAEVPTAATAAVAEVAVESTGVGETEPPPAPAPEATPSGCPFLRRLAADGRPVEIADRYAEGNVCAAYASVVALGRSQQELVCLAERHVSCPRYRRRRIVGPGRVPADGRWSPVVVVAAALLLVAALAVGGWVALQNARFGISPASPTPTAEPTPSPSPTPTPSPTLAPTPTPTAEPTPTASPTPAPTPSPTPAPTPTPAGSPDPFAGLPLCPGEEPCYVYTVRSDDNLSGIAERFGTTLDAILAINPEITDPRTIRVGQKIKIPFP